MSLAVSPNASLPAQDDFKRRLGQAIELKNQKRYAARILEELRETHPESASVHGLLGYALWQQNDPARAAESFRRAVKLGPESELASLGLFHTLLETGDRKGAVQEVNRFRRVADSKEYAAIAKEFEVTAPARRYAYVDNTSLFTEGQRASAVAKGMALDIQDALRRNVFDFTWRPDVGKLHRILFGKKLEIASTTLWGSLLPRDSLKKLAESRGWNVVTHESTGGGENHVNVAMAYRIAKDAALIDRDTSEVIIVSGDADFAPVVRDLGEAGFNVTVAFWSHAASELAGSGAVHSTG